MNCFLCDQPMVSGHTRWLEYGDAQKIAHSTCDRAALIGRARQLGVFDDPEGHTDAELIDAIAAERLSGEWLERLERLPTDEAKRDAVHRLRLQLEASPREACEQCGESTWVGSQPCVRCFYTARAAVTAESGKLKP